MFAANCSEASVPRVRDSASTHFPRTHALLIHAHENDPVARHVTLGLAAEPAESRLKNRRLLNGRDNLADFR